ncbi:MAG: TetR/AcrR family transcriptional regulator [Steroidobacteraceae bacterium]
MAKRRREDPQVRKTQLLQAAKRCFRTFGFQATTVDRIAAEAQVSVGLLYRFFDSKSAMIKAIILEDIEVQLEQAGIAIESSSGEVPETSRAVAKKLAESTVERDRIALMLEIAAEVCRDPALRSFVQSKRSQVRDALVKKLESKGISRKTAVQMLDKLEISSAIASGAAIHAMLYSSGSPESSMRLISKLISGA